MPSTRSRYFPTRLSKAATSPACTCRTTSRSASASSLRSGDTTSVFAMALLAFIRRGQGNPDGVYWQIETVCETRCGRRGAPREGRRSSDRPERGDLCQQDIAQRKQVARGQVPGPFGKDRARRGYLALDGRFDGVEHAKVEHLHAAERGLRRPEAADLPGERLSLGRRQPVHQRKQGKRELAARQVGAERLADLFLPPEKVGEVVIDLVGYAEMPAKPVQGASRSISANRGSVNLPLARSVPSVLPIFSSRSEERRVGKEGRSRWWPACRRQ